MADVNDLSERLAEHRRFITEDGPGPMAIRMYDGIADLLATWFSSFAD